MWPPYNPYMTFTIREAALDDAGALAALAALTFPLACPPSTAPADIARHVAANLDEQSFREYLADSGTKVLVVDDAGILQGYSVVAARPADDPDVAAAISIKPSAELSKCYVHPDQHGTGIAVALMDATLQAAAEAGARGVWLGVNSGNARAIRFYNKCGFRQAGTRSFRLGSRIEHDFVLERALP